MMGSSKTLCGVFSAQTVKSKERKKHLESTAEQYKTKHNTHTHTHTLFQTSNDKQFFELIVVQIDKSSYRSVILRKLSPVAEIHVPRT